jgi:AraC-like DNA-binding protein
MTETRVSKSTRPPKATSPHRLHVAAKPAGAVLVAPGVLAWLFPPGAAFTRTNIHVGQRVVVPLDGSPLSFRAPDGAVVETRSPVLVPPGVPYATLSAGPRIGLIVHPVRDGRPVVVTETGPTILSGRTGDRVRGAAEALLATPVGNASGDAHGELLGALGSPLGRVLDRRVRVVLETLAFEVEPPTLEMLSDRTDLSSERLRHLVVESLGIGLRRLLQWYRFTSALTRMWRPERLAHIAAETGFSDQAHLARTTRELLGHPPSLRTAIEWRILGNYHPR